MSDKDFKEIVKGYFMKNNYVLVLSVLTLISFVFSLIVSLGVLQNFGFVSGLIYVFPSSWWAFLGISLALSGVFAYYEKYWLMILPLMIWLLVVTVLVRTSNIPGLVDISTGEPTLGPDLDPWLFTRHAQEIAGGKLKDVDSMRAAPVGTQNYAHYSLMPWAIFYVYKIGSIFDKDYSVMNAAIISPVIFFAISAIAFFFLLFFLFLNNNSKANALVFAFLGSVLYCASPSMVARSVAGIPEIESLGMMWFWGAFLFFVWAWKYNDYKKYIPLGIISGILTGAMVWTWGGYRYIFIVLALSAFIIFFFGREKNKNILIYSSWLLFSALFLVLKTKSFSNLFSSVADSGLAIAVWAILFAGYIIDNKFLGKKVNYFFNKTRLPNNLLAIIVLFLLGILFLVFFNFSSLTSIIGEIIEKLLYPFGRGRIGLTVAENKVPYFVEVLTNFKYLFWLFFFGSLMIFHTAIKHFKTNYKTILLASFLVLLSGITFSRISPTHLMNGENLISRIVYIGSFLLFGIVLIYVYLSAYRKKDERTLEDFSKIDFVYIFMLAVAVLSVISMRGAIRLLFIISPLILIIASFVPIYIMKNILDKNKTKKIIFVILLVLWAIVFLNSFYTYQNVASLTSKSMVPSAYNNQWQLAMSWVRENTPGDSIFLHWWDYGYWIQSMGERATVTDGGHAVGFWDHTTARYLMTAQNERTALQLAKAHNADYFLIDSTDIGKYPAFASIGSDKTGNDRMSWISTFGLNAQQSTETKNQTILVYTGGTAIDENLFVKGKFYPSGKAGIGGFLVYVDKETSQISKVDVAVVYNGVQEIIPLRYLFINGQIVDFAEIRQEDYIEGMFYVIPSLENGGINQIGAGMYLSERALKTLWVKLYLLDQSENFELVHSEDSLFVNQVKQAGIPIRDFVFAGGLHGPIKIWKINIPEDVPYYEEYLQMKSAEEENWGELDYLGV